MIPFPHVLDSTMLESYKSCPHKFFRTYMQHYKPRTLSVHLHAGASFAAGLEAARLAFFRDKQPMEDCIGIGVGALMKHYGDFDCPPDSAKSLERTAGALEFYFSAYPLDAEQFQPMLLPSGKLGIEFSFVEPLPISHPETGDPILYCGRSDQIGHYANGVFIQDDKTATSLGQSWSRQWDLRAQFTGYCWLSRQALGVTPNGVLVRGVSILKTKYDTQEAVTYRTPAQIDEWLDTVLECANEMITRWKSGYWRKALGEACESYGGCGLKQVCQAADPEPWLSQYYDRRKWDPIARKEEPCST